MRRDPHVVGIGSAHGKIALYLTETQAIDLAHLYGLDDIGAQEIMEAVEKAYPKEDGRSPCVRCGSLQYEGSPFCLTCGRDDPVAPKEDA